MKSSLVQAYPPYKVFSKERYNDLRYDALCHKYGTLAARPAASPDRTNHTYYAADKGVLYRCTGDVWEIETHAVQATYHDFPSGAWETIFQNTTGRAVINTLVVKLSELGTGYGVYIGPYSPPNYAQAACGFIQVGDGNTHYFNVCFIVPKDWYYNITRWSGTSPVLYDWRQFVLGE